MGWAMADIEVAPCGKRRRQQGVVLAIALIMLMLLAILASISIHGASSLEQVSNQSRLRALAQQTAEAALRFCEQQVQANAADSDTGFAPEAKSAGVPYTWESMENWDKTPALSLKTVPVTAAGDVGRSLYFPRPSECMSQYVSPTGGKVFVTTARGFGPEVGAKKDNDKTPPKGTEVWLQSVVTLE
jgi:type IV pilus assembly protein PilX